MERARDMRRFIDGLARNPKLEIRNPKEIRSPKAERTDGCEDATKGNNRRERKEKSFIGQGKAFESLRLRAFASLR
jgi:hypothetical protein